MATKVRKQVYLEPHQEMLLKQRAQEQGLTEAEIIRRATEQHVHLSLVPRRDLAAWEKERAFILRLMEHGPAPGRSIWRREELHERQSAGGHECSGLCL